MQFDFNLGAGASQTIDVKGRFFKYKSGTGPIRVRVSGGGSVDLLPGQGVENVLFASLTVSDRSNASNMGSILAGDFDFRDDRISGTVDIVDGGKSRTLAGQSFSSAVLCYGAGGLYSTAQVFNPADSGKRVSCSKIIITSTISGLIKIGWNTAANGALPPEGVASKLTGGVSGKAKICNIGLAAEPAGFKYLGIYESGGGGGSTFIYAFAEPVLIMPGFGLNVQHGTIGTPTIQANFELVEESI